MKRSYALVLPFLAIALYIFSLFTLIHWSPEQNTSALAWNLGIILAPVLAMFAQLRMAKERGLPAAITLPVIAVSNTAMILGSRLGAWTLSDWSIAIGQGILPETQGKTIIGGLLLAIALFWLLKPWWKLPMGMADILMIGMPLAAVSARIGCFLAGCCYGTPTGAGWGVCYGPQTSAFEHYASLPGADPSSVFTQPLYPVQLLLMAGNLLIFFGLWQFRRRFSREGAISMLGLCLLSFQRFWLEFFRDVSTNRGELGYIVAGIKLVQWQSFLMALLALVAFFYFQFLRPIKEIKPVKANDGLLWPQLSTLLVIIAVSYALGPKMTMDETAVIIISCLPALFILGQNAWGRGRFLKQRLAPLSFISLSFLLLISDPLDSLAGKPRPNAWKRWFELSAGGGGGSIERKVITRDCDGNTHYKYQNINTRSWGGTFSANWEKDATRLSITAMGAGGHYDSEDSKDFSDNHHFNAFGLSFSFNHEVVGLSLGFMREKMLSNDVNLGYPPERRAMPIGAVRVGKLEKLSFDLRVAENPVTGFSMEPFASIGLRYGFNRRSGNTYLSGGIGTSSTDTGLFYLGAGFPIWKNKLYGGMTVFAGASSMINLGLKYRFYKAEKR